MLGFTGVRGIVSLAAALAIPLTIDNGHPFPDRDLILFLTFSVILVTLVLQGLSLPAVIRVLGLARAGERESRIDRSEELRARRYATDSAIERLERLAANRALPDDLVQRVRIRHRERLRHFERAPEREESHHDLTVTSDEIELVLIAAERERINELYRHGTLNDEARRRLERELDLREASGGPPTRGVGSFTHCCKAPICSSSTPPFRTRVRRRRCSKRPGCCRTSGRLADARRSPGAGELR